MENKIEQYYWRDVKIELPTKYPVIVLTKNGNITTTKKEINQWYVEKYSITSWCYPPE